MIIYDDQKSYILRSDIESYMIAYERTSSYIYLDAHMQRVVPLTAHNATLVPPMQQ